MSKSFVRIDNTEDIIAFTCADVRFFKTCTISGASLQRPK
jgi:hypothetical protein